MTEVNLNSIFSSLESQAAELNSASDTANQALADAEKRLVALNIGMEIWCPRPLECAEAEGGTGPYETIVEVVNLLGFARAEGKWCLAVKQVRRVSGFFEGDTNCPYTNEFLETPPAPLLKQSRSLRISALEALPEFLAQITEHVQSKVQEISVAASKLQ